MSSPGQSSDARSPLTVTVTLIAVFALSFLSVGFIGIWVGKQFLPALVRHGNFSDAEAQRGPNIPKILTLSNTNTFFRVERAPALEPEVGKDFLLLAWLNVAEFPDSGNRQILLGKFDSVGGVAHGYGLALQHDGEVIRPAAYWYGSKGKPRWYTFSEVRIVPGAWFLVVMSFKKGKYLGLHFGLPRIAGKPEVGTAGGYEFEEGALPSSVADLNFGGLGRDGIKGALGPVGLFSASKFNFEIKDLVKEQALSPGSFPSQFSKSEAVFWTTDGVKDQGVGGLKFTLSQGRRNKREKIE